ncbi:hypothetical protein [Embleya sp. NPDC005971]|uniref:hypothetical protein n=1 Tax=Embleya sp. NPDC005971 TaxID=3156724 RepID=UPI0033D21031
MLDLVVRLADPAERQHGHLTIEQCAVAGASSADIADLLAARLLEPVIEDAVLRIRGGGRHPFPTLYARWLLPAPDGAAGEERLVPAAEFTVPGPDPRPAVAGGAVLHVADLDDADWQVVSGLSVTTPARTLADLTRCPVLLWA